MNINFEYKDVSASARLEQLATEKLEKLEDKYDFIVMADVYFKKENTSSDNTGRICEIRINVPGTTLFSESNNEKFEISLAKAVSEVQRQLQKKKEKMKTHM
ncbi:MAG: ribosome-associated translation inhibitor RaiA [Flavobacteriales bacterium]|jgi:putative sigma-54 modulation protein|uniref:ribosome hibernation-promoting factor, HPF/YfiA family n=1 Tax=Candidatus Ulvibacter alkanivorans TaxID=2267620 RepID=UPI000DF13D8A|nr:ribosome-associated translation inhibitor RaiA [Candidatus Ulvibacter alkanivorans]MCH2489051.1 ribosome-associated translation inhibitor RaiA [Flavobacteriales bacterium]